MNSETELIKPCIGLLKLTEHMNKVTRSCKMMGISHDSFCLIKELYKAEVESALIK